MYLGVLKQEEKFGLCIWRLNGGEKSKTNAFNCYKLTSNLCMVYLDVKLQQDRWL